MKLVEFVVPETSVFLCHSSKYIENLLFLHRLEDLALLCFFPQSRLSDIRFHLSLLLLELSNRFLKFSKGPILQVEVFS